MKIYRVGGAVRDQLLGYVPHEQDWVVVGARAEQLLEQGFEAVGKSFPVFLHPKSKEEYALARTERKNGVGYTGFDCYAQPDVTLEQDLMRRDLTINAIAEDPDGSLIDPYQGQRDLDNRVLRHVSPAFREDPLRVLRLARFAARFALDGFSIAAETELLINQMVDDGELNHLTPERVWKETEKALNSRSPRVYFEVLRKSGALKQLFPELACLWGVPNPVRWHPEIDTGVHILMVLDHAVRLSDDPTIRFAALVHDVGKGLTPPERWPSHKGHEESGAELIGAICKRLTIPNSFRDLAMLVSRFHSRCHRISEAEPAVVVGLLEALDAWRKPERMQAFLTVCRADYNGRLGFEQDDYPQARRIERAYQATLAVDNRALVAAGYKGPEFKAAQHQARCELVAAQENE